MIRTGTARKQRILLVSTGPAELATDLEFSNIRRRLERTRFRDQLEVIHEYCVDLAELGLLLVRHEPVLLHVSGHGNDDGELVFPVAGGGAGAADAASFRKIVRQAPTVRYLVLNACDSSDLAEALASDVDLAIGVVGRIDSTTAGELAAVFYTALGEGGSIGHAFNMATAIAQCDDARLHRHADVDPRLLHLARPRNPPDAVVELLQTWLGRARALQGRIQAEFHRVDRRVRAIEIGWASAAVAIGLALVLAVLAKLSEGPLMLLAIASMLIGVARSAGYGARLVASRNALRQTHEQLAALAVEIEQLINKPQELDELQLERIAARIDALAEAPLLLGSDSSPVYLGSRPGRPIGAGFERVP